MILVILPFRGKFCDLINTDSLDFELKKNDCCYRDCNLYHKATYYYQTEPPPNNHTYLVSFPMADGGAFFIGGKPDQKAFR
jgi:hypothetical protein